MWDYLVQGRMFMVPLVLCSIIGLAIITERYLYLRSALKEASTLLAEIASHIEKGDLDAVERCCETNAGLLANIFLRGIQKYRQLKDASDTQFVQTEVSKAMEDASVVNTADLESRLPLLSTVGNVAPLFGFAGTVTGMMTAFDDIASDPNPSAQVVARGIKEALITTAAGLLIAIPVVLAYGYLTAKIDSLNTLTQETANDLIDLIVTRHLQSKARAQQ